MQAIHQPGGAFFVGLRVVGIELTLRGLRYPFAPYNPGVFILSYHTLYCVCISLTHAFNVVQMIANHQFVLPVAMNWKREILYMP